MSVSRQAVRERDAFLDAYIEAALFSTNDESTPEGGVPLDQNYTAGDIAPETLELMEQDADDFLSRYGDLLLDDDSRDIDRWGRWSLAGHDFWLTREGHGAGFWDGGWPRHGDELTDAAHAYGPFELYVGDDGLIYGPPPSIYRKRQRRRA
jgi:hypothetical protein